MPMFIITGSRINAAISFPCSPKSSSTAFASLKGTMIVSCHMEWGTPFDVGCVVYADPAASADSPFTVNRMSRTSDSGTTENRTASWWP